MGSFLSCDWGSSTFRLRLVDTRTRKIYGEQISDEGIVETHQQWIATGRPENERIHFYKNKIAASIKKLGVTVDKHTPVICSGMISSSIGLAELPYQKFPFTWDVSQFVVKKIDGDEKFSNPLYLVSGFKTNEDIMRGEESLLLGCRVDDDGEQVFIFPGTHSKHVQVKNKQAVDFKTYMTGEIFGLLADKSILRNAVEKGMDENAFAEGFQAALEGNLLHQVFMIRTRQVLKGVGSVSNYQYLSGLLIGAELRDLKDSDCAVYLVCGEELKPAYWKGLAFLGFTTRLHYLNAGDALVIGHSQIADHYL